MGLGAVLASLVAGCSGAEYSGASRSEFIARADSICKRSADVVLPLLRELVEAEASDRELRIFVDDVFASRIQARISELRQIDRPEDDREEIDRFLTASQRDLDAIESDPSILRVQPMVDARVRAKSYGLKDCAR